MTQYCSYEEMRIWAGSWRGECGREELTPLSRRPPGIQLPAVAPATLEGSPWDLLSCRPLAPSPPSGSSPSASPPADGLGALARLLPREGGSLPSCHFSSSFLVQERSTRPGGHVGRTYISPALPLEGYCCLLRGSVRLPSPAGLLKK